MSFKYSAYIDKICGDLDTHLEKLGYEFIITGYEDDLDRYTLIANGFVSYHKEEPTLEMASGHKSYDNFTCIELVNCIGNPQLFQAVSAIREGTDINQLFVDEMLELLTGEINLIMCERDDKKYLEVYTTLRKATLTELQEHFK